MNIDFFRRLGLLAIPNFLTAGLCSTLRAEMLSASGAPGMIAPEADGVVDEDVRRVRCVGITRELKQELKGRILGLQPELEIHFRQTFEGFEIPQFLIYSAGSFYRQHRDNPTGPRAPEAMKRRKVSVVIFLNSETDKPCDSSFGGGQLIFYGLLQDPPWKCGLPLTGAEGLLIAFRSDLEHEVTPVLHGLRLTVITWLF